MKKSFSTRAGRLLEFFWKPGTDNVQGINQPLAQEAVKGTLQKLKDIYPELREAKNATRKKVEITKKELQDILNLHGEAHGGLKYSNPRAKNTDWDGADQLARFHFNVKKINLASREGTFLERTGIPYRFFSDNSIGIVKVLPSYAHGATTLNLGRGIDFLRMALDPTPEYTWGGMTTPRPSMQGSRGKQPDNCLFPNSRTNQPRRPSLVIETGVTGGLFCVRTSSLIDSMLALDLARNAQ
ncbi:uncharacterized protein CDV56_104386 [Aspergillus thermomutatus]|uniref:Uncharacterized protein n=1 Tax=Aspergillus thermomutatus TaxID=41047 RepID=A0A397GVL4_ASPTH|nr:uncharacterized protein CDV56_104386 [Aspergillus thermomutatus]RHZ53113.1 hypothetical protein CDV56_104386 [Aspergillus thermomutatus]